MQDAQTAFVFTRPPQRAKTRRSTGKAAARRIVPIVSGSPSPVWTGVCPDRTLCLWAMRSVCAQPLRAKAVVRILLEENTRRCSMI